MDIANILKNIPPELRAQANLPTAALLSAALLAIGAFDTETAEECIVLAAKSSARWLGRLQAGKRR